MLIKFPVLFLKTGPKLPEHWQCPLRECSKSLLPKGNSMWSSRELAAAGQTQVT